MKIGIDFGTSFSTPAINYLDQNIVLLPGTNYGIPSLFFYDSDDGMILVGEEAERAGIGIDATNLIREIKMDLLCPFIKIGEREFSSTEIVAHILNNVVQTARKIAKEKLIDDEIEGVVITVPAKFGYPEKKIIMDAVQLQSAKGGPELNVIGVIKEPVAAALSYFQTSLENNTRVLVYDLGGGTCDIAIVEVDSSTREKFTVIDFSTERIGGKDWDQAICDYLVHKIEEQAEISINSNLGYYEKIKHEAINVKHGFSKKGINGYPTKQRAQVEINGMVYKVIIDETLFDEITYGLYLKTQRMVEKLLKEHPDKTISKIICVGGGSNMPQIQNGLRKAFCDIEIQVFEPATAVAFGAAYYANKVNISDILPYSYGVKAHIPGEDDNRYIIVNLIKQGMRLPQSFKQTFIRKNADDNVVSLCIFETDTKEDQFDYDEIKHQPTLELLLDVPSGVPKGSKIEVEMVIDTDGIVKVMGRDMYGNYREGEIQTFTNRE